MEVFLSTDLGLQGLFGAFGLLRVALRCIEPWRYAQGGKVSCGYSGLGLRI